MNYFADRLTEFLNHVLAPVMDKLLDKINYKNLSNKKYRSINRHIEIALRHLSIALELCEKYGVSEQKCIDISNAMSAAQTVLYGNIIDDTLGR